MSYTNGKIYKIVSKQTDKIYIGSTKETLEVRFGVHKSKYKSYIETNKGECSSIDILKYADAEIVLIELYPCESRTELCIREGLIQLENRSIIVNKYIAGRTQEEWYAENKDRQAQYYLDHKEHYTQYRIDHKEYNTQYRIDHKDTIAEQSAQYYLDHKEQIAQYYLDHKDILSAPVQCECGSSVRYDGKLKHFKSEKHKKYVLSLS